MLGVACMILVPQPGIKSVSLALKVQHPNYWTTREFTVMSFFFFKFLFYIGV